MPVTQIVIAVLALSSLFKPTLCIQNVLSGSTILLTPSNSYTSAQLNTIVDGNFTNDIAGTTWGICTGQNATMSIKITPATTSYTCIRSMFYFFHYEVTNSATYPYTVTGTAIKQNKFLNLNPTNSTQTYVNSYWYYAPCDRFASLTLTQNSTNGVHQLCTPEVLAVNQHPLYLIASQPTHVRKIINSTGVIESILNNQHTSLFNLTYQTNGACFSPSVSSGYAEMKIFFSGSSGSGNLTELLLMTSLVVVFGQQNTQTSIDVKIQPYSTSGTTFTNIETSDLHLTVNSSGVHDFSNTNEGIITNNLIIISSHGSGNLQLCQIIPLGYPYCWVKSILDTTTSINSYLISPATPQPAISKNFTITYLIDDAGQITNDQFCYYGLNTASGFLLQCDTCASPPTTSCSWGTNWVACDISTADLSNYGVQNFTLSLKDTRNTVNTSFTVLVFKVNFTSDCLSLVTFDPLPGVLPFNPTSTFANYFITDPQYSLVLNANWPTGCPITSSTRFTVNGTVLANNTNYQIYYTGCDEWFRGYDSEGTYRSYCKSYYSYWVNQEFNYTYNGDLKKFSLNWQTSNTGLQSKIYQIQIFQTFQANYSTTLNTTTRSFNLYYKVSCDNSTFVATPKIIAYDSQQNITNNLQVYSTLRGYNRSIDPTYPSYNQSYYKTFYKSWQFFDTQSQTMGNKDGFSYCFEREYIFEADSSNSNYDLAQSALMEKVVWYEISKDTYTFTLYVKPYDKKYFNQTLYYFIAVKLSCTPKVTKNYSNFQVLIDTCQVLDYRVTNQINNYEYKWKDEVSPNQTIFINQYPNCEYDYDINLTVNGTSQSSITNNTYGVVLKNSYLSLNKTSQIILYSTHKNPFLFGGRVYSLVISAFSGSSCKGNCSVSPFMTQQNTALYSGDICPYSTLFPNQNLTAMTAQVLIGYSTNQSFVDVLDYVSLYYGNKMDGLSLCGDRSYKIKEGFSFISVDQVEKVIVLEPLSNSEVGTYNLTMQASIKKYSNVTKVNFPFQVKITPCVLISVTASQPTLKISYTVGTGQQNYNLPYYIQNPPCAYSISKTTLVAYTGGKQDLNTAAYFSFTGNTMRVKIGSYEHGNNTYVLQLQTIFSDKESTNDSSIFVTMVLRTPQFTHQTLNTTTDFIIDSLQKVQKPKDQINGTYIIEEISELGEVTIKFSRDLLVPSSIQNSHSVNSRNKLLQNYSQTRLLNNYENFTRLSDFINKDSLSIQMQKRGSELQSLNWTAIDWTSDKIMLQIYFDDPLLISENIKQPDLLSIEILKKDFFIDSMTFQPFFSGSVDVISNLQIPLQLESKSQLQGLQNQAQAIQSASYVALIVTLILQIVGKKAITLLFEFYCALQIILLVHTKIVIQQPLQLLFFLNAIQDIVYMKVDTSLLQQYLKIPGSLLVKNSLLGLLGGIGIVGLFIVLTIGLVYIILRFKTFEFVRNICERLKKVIIFNLLIRYFQTAFLNLIYCAILSISQFDSLQTLITNSCIIIVCVLILISFYRTLSSNKPELLDTNETRQRIGNLYQGVSLESQWTIQYCLLFFVQRTLIVLVLVFEEYYALQFLSIIYIILFKIIYHLNFKPFKDRTAAQFDLMNQFILLLATYTQTWISPFLDDVKFKQSLAFCFNALIVLSYALNFAVLIYDVAIVKWKVIYLRKKQVKHRKVLFEQQKLAKEKKDRETALQAWLALEKAKYQEKQNQAKIEEQHQKYGRPFQQMLSLLEQHEQNLQQSSQSSSSFNSEVLHNQQLSRRPVQNSVYEIQLEPTNQHLTPSQPQPYKQNQKQQPIQNIFAQQVNGPISNNQGNHQQQRTQNLDSSQFQTLPNLQLQNIQIPSQLELPEKTQRTVSEIIKIQEEQIQFYQAQCQEYRDWYSKQPEHVKAISPSTIVYAQQLKLEMKNMYTELYI